MLNKLRLPVVVIGALFSYCSASFAATTVSFYAKDQHGSMVGATDENGRMATSLNQYNDYGVNQSNRSNNSGQISITYDLYQYSGEYTDQESGLQPLGNGYRYYDPALMRFISPDSYPLLNLYAYGSGNPIGNVDPTGHLSANVRSGGVSGVFMAVGMTATIVSELVTGGLADPLGLFALGLFGVEGGMTATANFDTHLSSQASERLGAATDLIDITGDVLDAAAGYCMDLPGIADSFADGSISTSVAIKKGAFLGARVFTDIEPTVNDVIGLSTMNSSNPTYDKMETYLSLANQFVGVTNYFFRGVDEFSDISDKWDKAGKDFNADSKEILEEKAKPENNKTDMDYWDDLRVAQLERNEKTVSKTYNDARTTRNLGYVSLAIRRSSLIGFRVGSIMSHIKTLQQEQQQSTQPSF